MIIGVVNNKGGVLKTTLSTNIAAVLSRMNKKVVIVDLDGQGNVIATFGKSPFNIENTIMDFLKGDCNLNDCLIKERENLYIIPGNDDLNFFDYYVQHNEITQSNLKLTLKKLSEVYDYVIIDTPPNMSTVVAIVLSISDVALIPFEPDQYAILGLRRIVDATKEFINKGNANMKVIAVPTKVNTRVTIHNEIIQQIRNKLLSQNIYVTNSYISASTKSTASVGYEKVPIVFSIVKSKYQDEYLNLANEVLYIISNNETYPIQENKNLENKINNIGEKTLNVNESGNISPNFDENKKSTIESNNDIKQEDLEGLIKSEEPIIVDNINKNDDDAPCLTFNYSNENENK